MSFQTVKLRGQRGVGRLDGELALDGGGRPVHGVLVDLEGQDWLIVEIEGLFQGLADLMEKK
jgi:hypothetical protein